MSSSGRSRRRQSAFVFLSLLGQFGSFRGFLGVFGFCRGGKVPLCMIGFLIWKTRYNSNVDIGVVRRASTTPTLPEPADRVTYENKSNAFASCCIPYPILAAEVS